MYDRDCVGPTKPKIFTIWPSVGKEEVVNTVLKLKENRTYCLKT